ncbi:MAG: molybdopterin-dependent oxidoreductase, partial [Desulfobulbaceae bacterium]|nr:molybdopterin-dependent oxidoreductase [Desulfobulbaceae bacterium]
MTGLATTFGSGAMTNSINEIENAQVILVSGSNTTEAHPQVARRMLDAVDRGAKLIVIDPRKTILADCAHIHLALRPGTDIPLLNAMMRIILDENLADDLFIEMRTENFYQLRDMLYRLDLDEVAATTGVSLEKISKAAQIYARAQKAVLCYCLGITQHICGTRNVQSLANLAMLTGNLEKEDTGVDPLRGQNNVQGA